MRSTWERIVEEILFNGTIQRFSPEIKTQNLEAAPFNLNEDYPKLHDGMKRCSLFLHDKPPEISMVLPRKNEISDDIRALEEFAQSANKRRKQLSGNKKHSKGIEAILVED